SVTAGLGRGFAAGAGGGAAAGFAVALVVALVLAFALPGFPACLDAATGLFTNRGSCPSAGAAAIATSSTDSMTGRSMAMATSVEIAALYPRFGKHEPTPAALGASSTLGTKLGIRLERSTAPLKRPLGTRRDRLR